MQFDGVTYNRQDGPRLWTQLEAVRHLMSDGQWRTLHQIQDALWWGYGSSASEAGVSARLRDLRKAKFGGYVVDRRRFGGLWEYRVSEPLPTGQLEML